MSNTEKQQLQEFIKRLEDRKRQYESDLDADVSKYGREVLTDTRTHWKRGLLDATVFALTDAKDLAAIAGIAVDVIA